MADSDNSDVWVQPSLDANGAAGGSEMAVWSNEYTKTYLAFNDGFTSYLNAFNKDIYIRAWIPQDIHISTIELYSSDGYIPSHGIVQGSDDGETWTTIGQWDDETNASTQTASVDDGNHVYHYFSFQSTSRCALKSGNADVTHITIHATYSYNLDKFVSISLPTARTIERTVVDAFAANRKLSHDEMYAYATKRALCVETETSGKTKRTVERSIELVGKTLRVTGIVEHFFLDTLIRKPVDTTIVAPVATVHDPFHPGVQHAIEGTQSMTITLNELSLSDTFQIVTTKDLMVNDLIKGKILDFSYVYAAQETDRTDKLLTVQGMYDKDYLLYLPLRFISESAIEKEREARQNDKSIPADYRSEIPVSSKWIIAKVASILGFNLDWRATDYLLEKGNFAGDGHTYQSIISSSFGWTNVIPEHQINVFMRAKDNCLHVIQRGQESTVTSLDGVKHTRPNVHREIVRTMWSSRKPAEDDDQDRYLYIAKTGETVFQGIHIKYVDGLLTYTKQPNADGGWTSVTYDYGFDEYGGAPSDNVAMLKKQTTKTWEPKSGHYSISTTTYYHPPEVPGYVYAVTETDGKITGTSLSQQEKRANVSKQYEKYCIHRANPDKYKYVDSFVADASIPIVYEDMRRYAVINEIKSMNRKVKETITMDIYDSSHVFDFDERYTFRGHTYYLASNQISKTPKVMKQTVKLVRWFR